MSAATVSFATFKKELTQAAASAKTQGIKKLLRPDGRQSKGKPENLQISTVLHVANTLAGHADFATGDRAFPGTKLLAAETGRSRDTVGQCLRLLRELGWLIRTHKGGGHSGKADEYRLAIGRRFTEAQAESEAENDSTLVQPERSNSAALAQREADVGGVVYRVGEVVSETEYQALKPARQKGFAPQYDGDGWQCFEEVVDVWARGRLQAEAEAAME